MNTLLSNLAGRSAVKKDHGSDPPPPDFSDSDISSEGAFRLHGALDSDPSDIQWIKPFAVKPTLDLATVPVWDQNTSTRDNAQAVKISLGSAGYLDTTKGKGTHHEQLILLASLRHATANYPMAALAIIDSISMDSRKCGYAAWTALFTELQGSAMEERRRLEEEIAAGQLPNAPVHVYVRRYRNLWNLLRKAHGQWTFEYVAINYLIPGLHPAYDHIVDATISATNVNKSGLPVMLTCTTTAPGGAATGAQEGEGEDGEDDELHGSWHNCPDALALPEVLSSLGACTIVRAASCGSAAHCGTLLWTIIAQPQDIRNCVNNVAAIKLANPGPFSGYGIYNPVTGRTTPPLPMPAFQFSNADYLMDELQPSGQQEGPHAPPPMLPSAALASAQEGPPSPHHNEQHPPHRQSLRTDGSPAP
eukprot:jgi/Tetstr1/459071/TSEL_000407.t1